MDDGRTRWRRVAPGIDGRCSTPAMLAPGVAAGHQSKVPTSMGPFAGQRRDPWKPGSAARAPGEVRRLRAAPASRPACPPPRPWATGAAPSTGHAIPSAGSSQRIPDSQAALYGLVQKYSISATSDSAAEPARERGRRPEQQRLVGGRLHGDMPAERRRAGPDVDGDHERATGDDPHELALRRVPLEVQPAHDAARRPRLVDLDEARRAARAASNASTWRTSVNQPRSSGNTRGRTSRTSGMAVGSTVNGTATSSPGRRRPRAPGP